MKIDEIKMDNKALLDIITENISVCENQYDVCLEKINYISNVLFGVDVEIEKNTSPSSRTGFLPRIEERTKSLCTKYNNIIELLCDIEKIITTESTKY